MEIHFTATALKTFLLMLSCKDNVSPRQTRIWTSLFPKTFLSSQSSPCTFSNGKMAFFLDILYICDTHALIAHKKKQFKIFSLVDLIAVTNI